MKINLRIDTTIIIDTLNNISHLLETGCATKKKKIYSTSHVFYDLYNFLSFKLSTDDKMSLHTFFHGCEKSLAEARGKHFNSSQFWLDYVNQFYEGFSDDVKISMGVLYLPAVAFHKYRQNDYTNAIAYTEKSIAEIDVLKHMNMSFIIASKMEQYLNICRVIFATKDYDKAFEESGNLLSYILTGNTTNTSKYQFNDDPFVQKLDISIHKLVINFITEELIVKWYKINNELDKSLVLKKLFLPLWSAIPSKDSFVMTGYKEFVMALQFYYEENHTSFLQQIKEVLSSDYEVPNMLQYLIFDILQTIAEKMEYRDLDVLKENINNYYKQSLEFDPTDVLGNKTIINSSPIRKLEPESIPVTESEPVLQ